MATDKHGKKIAIIGFGHLGKALQKGFLHAGITPEDILCSNRNESNKKAVQSADVIFITTKPFQVRDVIEEIKDVMENKILICAAAGVGIGTIQKMFGKKPQKIVRIMPNIPVSIGCGVIGFFPSRSASNAEKEEIKKLLSGLGLVIEAKSEKDLDALTLLSACGPGMVAYFIVMLSNAAVSMNISKTQAEKIAVQTFFGTVSYLLQANKNPKKLLEEVGTKGGVTEEITTAMDSEKIPFRFQISLKKGKTKLQMLREKVNSKD